MSHNRRIQKKRIVVDSKRRLLAITAALIVVLPACTSASTAPVAQASVPAVDSAATLIHQDPAIAAANLSGSGSSVSSIIGGGGNGSSSSDDEMESSSDFEEAVEHKWSEDEEEHSPVKQPQELPQESTQELMQESTQEEPVQLEVVEEAHPVVEVVEEEDMDEAFDDASEAVPSQPLKTLKKLQQMLDETDYMTTTTSMNSKEAPVRKAKKIKRSSPPTVVQAGAEQASLYERQQQQESVLPPPPLPPQHVYEVNHPSETTPAGYLPLQQQQHEPPQLPSQQSPPHQNPEKFVQPGLPEKIPTRQSSLSKQQKEAEQVRQLWTSKDRSKYKKMQQMQRRADEERRRLEQHLLQQPNSSDDEGMTDEGMTDTDDGLMSYTLPNLPVYMSDAEGEGSDGEYQAPTQQLQQQQPLQSSTTPTYPQQQRQQDMYAYAQHQQQSQHQYGGYPRGQYPPPPHDPQLQQPPPYMGYQNTGYAQYPPNMPYSGYEQQQQYSQQQQMTPQQQQQHQQMLASQYAAAWGYSPRPILRTPPSHAQAATRVAPTASIQASHGPATFQEEQQRHQQQQQQQQLVVQPEVPTTLAEASSQLNFDSIQKFALLFVGVACLAYCAVSPRNLPLAEYNRLFYDNLRLVAFAGIAPMANFLLVCDARENDVNSVVTSFYTSFTVGYCLAFILEIVLTTALRLGVFACWEPNIFKLSPKVPRLVLPWVVRENKYRPKRITLFAADFLTSCVASPIVEEYVKLKILQLSVRLPRNFVWYTKVSTNNKNKKKRKRRVAEAATKNPGEPEITNINSYVTHMLAVSTGMKLCDSARRILMYTKADHMNKSFYALFRGLFPIHELCGTMTALALAKRDVLGVDMPIWKMLLPAVFIHGMANFRGMKPIYKWNAATPWSEMQLSPWHAADDSTLPQLMNKGFAKLMWLIILGRVLGYCIKNYYLISRQARKRTTTYAGKQAAFSAELAAAEMLKKTKDKK